MANERLNAENAVAGAILIDPRAFDLVADALSPEDFQSELCRSVYQAAQGLSQKGEPIDPVAIGKYIRESGGQISNDTIVELMDITPTAANAPYYAGLVRDKARRRGLHRVAEHILEDDSTPTDEMLSSVAAEVSTLVEAAVGNRCVTSSDMMRSFYADLEAREGGRKNFVSSGFPMLDDCLGGGFLNGGLYIIAARPGMGKTTLALNLAESFPGGVLFVSLEMSENQLTAKRVARETGIPSNRLLLGSGISEEESEKICTATVKLSGSGLSVNRRMGATVPEIGVMARSVHNLSAVVVDYLGLIQHNGAGSRYEAVTEISGALKRLAMSLNVPIIALAQLNRAAETRLDKKPCLADLRDSGAIEQDADGVLLLYRQDYYEKQDKPPKRWTPSLIECEVAKNRHAATGKVLFNAYLSVSRIAQA